MDARKPTLNARESRTLPDPKETEPIRVSRFCFLFGLSSFLDFLISDWGGGKRGRPGGVFFPDVCFDAGEQGCEG